MSRTLAACLLAVIAACSTPVETGPRVYVRHALRPATFGRLVQTVNALRLVAARSDPMQAALPAALAHIVSIWYGLPSFDEGSQEEEAYLLRFCRGAGWEEGSVPDCAKRIYRTVLEQAGQAVLEFSRVPSLKQDAENIVLELEALRQEGEFPSIAVWHLGERRPGIASAQRRRMAPGLPVVVEKNNFFVFGSSEIPLTHPERIREIFEHASALEPPAAVSLLAASDARTASVLMVLGIARAAGIARIWAWGVHEGRSAAVELELVAERDPALASAEGSDPAGTDGTDVSGMAAWGDALGGLSSKNPPIRLRVPLFRAVQDDAAPPPLSDIRRRLIEQEP